eukprot:6253649-Amphidinium_carterae.1
MEVTRKSAPMIPPPEQAAYLCAERASVCGRDMSNNALLERLSPPVSVHYAAREGGGSTSNHNHGTVNRDASKHSS